ncbi:MAG: DUF4340 domain-containing protein [Planctomycetota bacterium]
MIRSILPLNRVLLAVVAVLVALLVGLERDAVETRPVESLLPEFDAAAATEVRLVASGGEGGTTLSREGPADPWTIDQYAGASASASLVDGFMSRIGAMTTLDLVSDDPGRFAEYEVDESSAVRIVVLGGGADEDDDALRADETLADVFVSSARGTAVYVRRANDASIYRVPRMPLPPTDPFRWFDRAPLVPYENVQIDRVTLGGEAVGEEDVVVVQPVERFGTFQDAEGEPIPSPVARELFERLRSLFPTGVVGRGDGTLTDPESAFLRVDVRLRTGGELGLLIGALDDAGVPARRGEDDLVVLLDARAVEGVLAAARALID